MRTHRKHLTNRKAVIPFQLIDLLYYLVPEYFLFEENID